MPDNVAKPHSWHEYSVVFMHSFIMQIMSNVLDIPSQGHERVILNVSKKKNNNDKGQYYRI